VTTPINPYPGNTAWPSSWQGSRLTGRFVDILGQPIQGYITLTPSAAAVLDSLNNVVVLPATRKVTLDATGAFDVVIPATDDPDMNPTNFTYTVQEVVHGGRSYSINAPMNKTQDLADIAPVPSSNGVTIVRGEPGVGVKPGGSVGQILAKASAADFDTTWINPPAGSGGSSVVDQEVVRDTIASALRAGSGVNIVTDDAADTITISATGGGGGGNVAYVTSQAAADALPANTLAILLEAIGYNLTPVQTSRAYSYDGTVYYNTITVPMSAPTPGNLLLLFVGVDKDSGGGHTTPTGWTQFHATNGASVSGAAYFKIAAGGETSVSASWNTYARSASAIVFEMPIKNAIQVTQRAMPYSDVATAESVASLTTALASAGVAFAWSVADSWDSRGAATLTAGWTYLGSSTPPGSTTPTSVPSMEVAVKAVVQGETPSVTFYSGSFVDQSAAGMAVIK
jgi:hypothetical protein